MSAAPVPDYVVIAFGSEGDVLPLAALASALRQRGHAVTLLAPAPFEALAREQGLGFHSIIDEAAARGVLDNPLLWHPNKGIQVLWPAILHAAKESMRWLGALAAREGAAPCLVGSTMALGARVAHERWGWPHATVHVSACWWFSASDPPRFRGLGWLGALGPSARAKVWAWVETRLLDPIAAPSLNAWRAGFGLPPARRVFGRWSASPQCILGFYPPWFAPRPADAPRHMQLVGFALPPFDALQPLDPDAGRFLQTPQPTVTVMAGSQMQHAQRFFATAMDAVRGAGAQAVLLGPGAADAARGQMGAFGAEYLPLAHVLPRCRAIVSHPGIGTIARALAAGVPQLLTPYAFDHFDNARRAVRLGVAREVPATASARRLASELRTLMEDAAVAAACRSAQARMAPHADVMAAACGTLERLRTDALSVAAASA